MKRRFSHLITAIVGLSALSVVSISVIAQGGNPIVGNGRQTPLPPGGAPPRSSDGHVDLSGIWYPGPYGMVGSDPGERVKDPPIPFQPSAAAKIKAMSPTELQLNLTRVECAPLG